MKEMIQANEALRLILENCKIGREIETTLDNAIGHAIAQEIKSDRNIPPFNRASMDGFAVRTKEFHSDARDFRIAGEVLAGSSAVHSVGPGDCLKIMTGAPVPPQFDAVIKVENSITEGDRVRITQESVKPWENIAMEGEDAKTGDTLIGRGTRADSASLPILAATGYSKFNVISRPTVSLVSTGDELVHADNRPEPHQIRDSSSYAIGALLHNFGISFENRILAGDVKEDIQSAIQKGLSSNVLVITGGVSMGVSDFVPEILESLGVKKIFHKIKIKPGKPLLFGISENGCAVFGLPGNPVSSQICFRIFVDAYIRKFMGLPPERPLRLPLLSERKKRHDREEYAQCRIVENEGISCIEMIQHHGSGDFVNLRSSDGIMVHPAEKKEISAGECVDFYFWRSPF